MLPAPARLLNVTKKYTAIALFVILGSCVPSTPFDSLALEGVSPGVVRMLYTSCTPERLLSLEVIAPSGPVFDEKDERVWKVIFEPPSDRREFVLGEAPPSSSVLVPWQGLRERKTYVALITTASMATEYQDFRLGDLRMERVRFHSKNITKKQFDEERRCK